AGLRWAGPVALALGAAVAALALTDYAGLLRAAPILGPVAMEPRGETRAYAVSVTVKNRGNRPFWIGGDRVSVPLPSAYAIEQTAPDGNWKDAGPPERAVSDGVERRVDIKRGLAVPPGGEVLLIHQVPPG